LDVRASLDRDALQGVKDPIMSRSIGTALLRDLFETIGV
jgi:hypothetical protein